MRYCLTMKFFIALSLLVATTSAGLLPELRQRLPLMPVLSPEEMEGRITNGEIAAPEQFPYQVGLSLEFAEGSAWCGGSLIDHRHVITAAHCADGAKGVTVYLGAQNIKLSNEKGQQRIYSSNLIVHPEWDPTTLSNDIAIIKMPVAVEYNDRIQPILLPKLNGQYSSYEGEKVVASGWGKPSDQATSVSEELRYIDTTVITQRLCKTYYLGLVSDKMVCISTKEGRSTCNGDSGGPLAYTDDQGDTYLIGATSFGLALGCEVGWPGVFTRVTSYLEWIKAVSGVENK